MKSFTYVIERCPETSAFFGYVPGIDGAHSVGDSLDELKSNMQECMEMLLEDGDPVSSTDFVGTLQILVNDQPDVAKSLIPSSITQNKKSKASTLLRKQTLSISNLKKVDRPELMERKAKIKK
jgi:predicted RNase H-like HicB family nuclease